MKIICVSIEKAEKTLNLTSVAGQQFKVPYQGYKITLDFFAKRKIINDGLKKLKQFQA